MLFCNIFLSPEFLLIYQALLTIGGIFIVAYVKKVAENKAVLKDLKKITKTVEEVKKDFNTDLEFLKAELNNKIHKKNLIYSDEKNTILEFFSQLNKWLWDGLSVNIHEFNHNNFELIDEALSKMRNDYNKTNIAFSKLQLLVDDKSLVQIGHTAVTKTLDLHNAIELNLSELRMILVSENAIISRFVENKDYPLAREMDVETSKENNKRRDAILKSFYNSKTEKFPILNNYRLEFADKGKIYIKK